MSHFINSYIGNKFKEYEKQYKSYIPFDGIRTVIEPFGGSGAMSFAIWREHKDLHFVINDISETTFKLYELYRTMAPEELKEKIDERCEYLKVEEHWQAEKKKIKDNIFSYIIFNKFYGFRPGMYPKNKPVKWKYEWTKLQLEFYEFINSPNVMISNKDWFEVFEEHKDDSTALLLFDPPYLESCNGYYDLERQANKNVYQFFAENDDNKFNSKIYFILEPNWIIKLLFKNHNFIFEYAKRYSLSKKITSHSLIQW